jgi:hypothetical protein
MKIEDLTPEQLAEMAKNGNYPHQQQMNDSGLNYNNLPADLKQKIRAVELAFRASKSQDKIESNIKKSILIADEIITLSEEGRNQPPLNNPKNQELENQKLAEQQRLASEQSKNNRSFGNSALDTIFGI